MTAREQRRLAAIFVLDVFGFSRQMAEDESGTLARVLDQRRTVIEPLIAEHDGRIVKLMGDGVLAEFPSVTFAVQCADAIQQAVAAGLAAQGGKEPLLLRIGINLGEVIADGDDIYGDGVNVAARLEALAPPGGIAVSASVYEQVHKRSPLAFENKGPHAVKNIPEPVQVWQLAPGLEVTGVTRVPAGPGRRAGLRATVLATALAVAVGGGVWWVQGGGFGPGAAVADPLATFDPGKPSVVVLPFENLSGESDQRYFSDGITESLITDLSRVGGLLVIARNTSFSFRDQTVDIGGIARELGVHYVVTGSVQRSGDRLRINATVTDTETGYQLWADRFDRETGDLFALQDEVTGRIVTAMQVEMTEHEAQVLAMQDTESVEAYEHFLNARGITRSARQATRGLQIGNAGAEPATPPEAGAALDAALDLDPGFTLARVSRTIEAFDLSGMLLLAAPTAIAEADAAAMASLEAGNAPPQMHSLHALGLVFGHRFDEAVDAARQAVIDDPNFADGYATLGWVLQFAGQAPDGLRALDIAQRLNPRYPGFYPTALAEIDFALGDDAATIESADAAIALNPLAQRARLYRAASLANLGRFDEAGAEVAKILAREPGVTLAAVTDLAPYRSDATLDRLLIGLRQAGLPD